MGVLIRDREEKAVWGRQQVWSEAATRNVNSHQILERPGREGAFRGRPALLMPPELWENKFLLLQGTGFR